MRVQVGLVSCLFAFLCGLVRRSCGLWVWAVATVHPRQAWLGVRGQRLRCVARVPRLVIRLQLRLRSCGGLGSFNSCGLGSGAVGRRCAHWRVRWRPSPSSLLGLTWRVSCRRLRTYGWSLGAGRLRGSIPGGFSASASMATHADGDILPPGSWRRQFSADPFGAGPPGPPGRALPGPTFAAPRAACWSSAATTGPEQGRSLQRRCGRRCVWWGHGDRWRWLAEGDSS